MYREEMETNNKTSNETNELTDTLLSFIRPKLPDDIYRHINTFIKKDSTYNTPHGQIMKQHLHKNKNSYKFKYLHIKRWLRKPTYSIDAFEEKMKLQYYEYGDRSAFCWCGQYNPYPEKISDSGDDDDEYNSDDEDNENIPIKIVCDISNMNDCCSNWIRKKDNMGKVEHVFQKYNKRIVKCNVKL
jgi:hypothetical protein